MNKFTTNLPEEKSALKDKINSNIEKYGENFLPKFLKMQKKFDIQKTLDMEKNLSNERKEIYRSLEMKCSNMDLVDLESVLPNLEIPNDNKIIMYRTFNNPLGENHYSRVFVQLMKFHEAQGDIIPGQTKIFETTSGSGGIACAAVCEALGYNCVIGMAGGGEKAREDAITKHNAELILTSPTEYIDGYPAFIKNYLSDHKEDVKAKKLFFLSHSQRKPMPKKDSMGKRLYETNTSALESMNKITLDILDKSSGKIDFLISALGNGTGTLGIGNGLHIRGTKIIGYEPFESGLYFDLKHPGRYKETFDIKPGALGRSKLPGLSAKILFTLPHILGSIPLLEDKIYLVGNKDTQEKYNKTMHGKKDVFSQNIIRYDEHNIVSTSKEFGRSTKAGILVALETAKEVHDKTILVLGYDKANRYDDYQNIQQ